MNGKPKFENFPPGTPGREEQEEKAKMIEQETKALQEKGVLPVEQSVVEAEMGAEQKEEKKKSWIASARDKVMGLFVDSPEKLKAKGRQEIKRNKFKNEAYQNLLKTEPEKAEKYLIAAGKYKSIKWSKEENNYVDGASYHYS